MIFFGLQATGKSGKKSRKGNYNRKLELFNQNDIDILGQISQITIYVFF